MGPRLAVQIVETSSFQEMEISILDAAAKWSDNRLNISYIWTSVSWEEWPMYELALWAMGPILDVRVVQTIGFHKMEINPLDAVG